MAQEFTPIVTTIEAVQYDGTPESADELTTWTEGAFVLTVDPLLPNSDPRPRLWVAGFLLALELNDWVLKDATGFRFLTDTEFQATYGSV